jgi:hypothetical protein
MEKLEANVSTVKNALSRQLSARWREVVVLCVTKCALHFRAKDDPLTDLDFEIFLDGLRDIPDEDRIAQGFDACLKQCEFMPRLRDVRDRVPDNPAAIHEPDLKVVKEWDEPYGRNMQVHYIEYEGGYRQARIVR